MSLEVTEEFANPDAAMDREAAPQGAPRPSDPDH